MRRAKAAGLAALALTDHDSVRGIPEARDACREAGILFVPGLELGVGVGSDEIHLLGYGIDAKGRTLQHALDLLAGERLDRMEKMLAALARQGIAVTLDEVRAETGGGIVGRLHLAAALVRGGHAADLNEAFRRWIGAGRPAYVRRHLLNLREAIDLIREAGGVPVMAHPGMTRRDELIEYLVRLGIRGLEVYYPKHDFVDVGDRAMILILARHELRRLFLSPLAWTILAVVQLILAWMFLSNVEYYQLMQSQMLGMEGEHGVTEAVVTPLLGNAAIVLLLIVPLISMRLITEERRNKTLALLFSAPLSMTEIVLGKYLGLVFFLGIQILLIALMPLSLLLGGGLDFGLFASGLLGLALLLAGFAAVGLFMSTLTQHQTVAAVGTFGVLLLFWDRDRKMERKRLTMRAQMKGEVKGADELRSR